MIRTLVWLLPVLLSIANASAQQDRDSIKIRFTAQARPADLGQLVMVAAAEEEERRSAAFNLPVNHLTEPQTAPGRLFRLEPERQAELLAEVRLPETGNDFVVLLVPGEDSPYEAVVIPYRGQGFRPGDYYLHNVSGLPVLGRVGATEFVIAPRSGRVVRPTGARDERFYDVLLGVREGNASRAISQSRWPVATHTRTYVFFFDDPVRRDVGFRAVDEFVPEADAPEDQTGR